MPVFNRLYSAVFALLIGASGAVAQGIGGGPLPAEFPPASFDGRQYVDSQGCAFIRAGVGGATTWVPRVTRSREQVCGLQPTFGKPVAQPAPAPTQVAKAEPPKPTPPAAKPAPKPAAEPVRTVASVTTPPRAMAPAPRRVAPTPPPAPQPAMNCPELGDSARFMQGEGVRCGPQDEPPVTYAVEAGRDGSTATKPAYAAPTVRADTYRAPPAATTGIRVPDGYRPVWKDDRLNPNRGPRTAQGDADSDLIWTQTVPRRLIDRRTGQDVTRLFPGLSYPHTTFAAQSRQAVAAPQAAPVATAHQFVQVGTFGVPANAQRSAARLQQAGLPVQTSSFRKGGKSYQVVFAGPFGNSNDLAQALHTARQAGFRDAFLR